MPIRLSTVSGSRFFIASAPVASLPDVDVQESDFATFTWTEVGQYQTMGDAGDGAENVATNHINRRRTINVKGTRQAPQRNDNFSLNLQDAGQLAMIAAEASDYNWPFRIDMSDAVPSKTLPTPTITIAAPGVVTSTAHGLVNGTKVRFSTTGALPTGLLPATDYYVVGATTNTFSLSLTKGGASITTTGTQSGVHTATTTPTPSQRFFMGMVVSAIEGMGDANTVAMLNCTEAVNTNYVRVAALG